MRWLPDNSRAELQLCSVFEVVFDVSEEAIDTLAITITNLVSRNMGSTVQTLQLTGNLCPVHG